VGDREREKKKGEVEEGFWIGSGRVSDQPEDHGGGQARIEKSTGSKGPDSNVLPLDYRLPAARREARAFASVRCAAMLVMHAPGPHSSYPHQNRTEPWALDFEDDPPKR